MKRPSVGPFNYNPGKRFDSRIAFPQHQQLQRPQRWHQYPHPHTPYFNTPPPGYNNSRTPFTDNNFETASSPAPSYLSEGSGTSSGGELISWDFSIPPPSAGVLPVLPPFAEQISINNLSRMQSTQRLPFTSQNNMARLGILGQPTSANNAASQESSVAVIGKKAKKKQQQIAVPAITWTREDAIKAIALEEEYSPKQGSTHTLILSFPDPYLNHDIVKEYSPNIETVHFHCNSAPRYCHVHLREGADYKKTIETISKIPFGTGFISAALKPVPAFMLEPSSPDNVDPTRLYIGNLPPKMTAAAVKEYFHGYKRVDVGHAHRMKFTRYAILRYDSAEKAMEAYKQTVNTLIESRSLIVRFFRSNIQKYNLINEVNMLDEKEWTEGNAIKGPEETLRTSPLTISTQLRSTGEDSGDDSNLSSLLEEPETIESDSKANVLFEAAKLRQTIQLSQQRRCSLDEIFEELDRRQPPVLSNSKPTEHSNLPTLSIKAEKNTSDDDLSEDDDEPSNLLGLRYQENSASTQIKSESEDEPAVNQSNRENILDGDFDSELEEEDDDHWTGILAPSNHPLKNSQNSMTNESTPNLININPMEILRQQQLSVIEKKPDINELTEHATTTTRDLIEHKKFVEYLNKQVNDFEKENGPRQSNELDDLFDQMNSDSEQEVL